MKKAIIFCCLSVALCSTAFAACVTSSQAGTAAFASTDGSTNYLTVIAPFHGTNPALCTYLASRTDFPCKTFACASGVDCAGAVGSCVNLLLQQCDDGPTTIQEIIVLPATSCGPA